MPPEIELSNSQRYVLAQFAQAMAHDEDAQPHWSVILLAATDKYATQDVEARTGAPGPLVEAVLEKWKEGAESLAEAERVGMSALQSAIEDLFTDYEDFDTECFCCCDDEADASELSMYEIEMLAGKVYQLLRHELVIERERLGYAYFGRY
jgi:hypothetical protein